MSPLTKYKFTFEVSIKFKICIGLKISKPDPELNYSFIDRTETECGFNTKFVSD